jgi:predicted RNA-binding Zn ribbon-like protein
MRRRDSRGEIDLPAPAEPYRLLVAGNIALDFANTVDEHNENKSYDYLFPGYGNLIGWSLYAGLLDAGQASAMMRLAKREPREAVAVRRRAVALREAIFTVLGPGAASDDDLAVLNDEWHIAAANRLLTQPDPDVTPEWTWKPEPALDSVLWAVTLAALDLLTSERRGRVRMCESPTCEWLFLDTTKNGSRRFCRSQGCGNRVRVQRFREAKREAAVG